MSSSPAPGPVEQNVPESFLPLQRRIENDLQPIDNLLLPNDIVQFLRSQLIIQLIIVGIEVS